MPSAEDEAAAEKSSTSPEATTTTTTANGKIAVEPASGLPAGAGKEEEEEEDVDEDPTTRQIRVALEALRARRAELREANAEIDTLGEQLLKAQGDAETEREAKEFIRTERDLLEKAKAAYAADLDVLKSQLVAARTTIDEERTSSQKFQTELGEERRARSSLSSDIERLQSQLGVLSSGLKKLQGRFSDSTAELEATKKEKAALLLRIEEADMKHAAAAALEANLATARAELEEQQALAASLQQELSERRQASESSVAAMEALQAQLGEAREELGRGQEARLGMLSELRGELEVKFHGAWAEICQELEQAPHRMLCTGPSLLRPRRAHQKAASHPLPASGPRIAFPVGESLTSRVAVTSFRDLKSDIWYSDPEANVACDRCDACLPKIMGRMVKMQGRSEQALQEFICLECARAEAVENKKNEEKNKELRVLDSKRNDELKSFFPKSSPTREVSEKAASSESSEYSESSSSPPHSSDSPPHSESPAKRRSLAEKVWNDGHRKRRRR